VNDERARLFVALELPEQVREALATWRSEALRELVEVRAVAVDSLHVTLCFLGWRPVREIEPIAEAVEALRPHGAATLAVAGAQWLPPRRPRVLAVKLDDAAGALGQAQAALSAELEAGGWFVPEARPFLAHVTVARVAKGARLRKPVLREPPALAFDGSAVTLFRSRLSPAGARYEALRTARLRS
jgi:2'-5' RNA ligase